MDKLSLIKQLESYQVGLKRGTVRLAPYQSSWVKAYQMMKELIQPYVSSADIFHIGSTSIPGCLAKPIIDIMIRFPSDSTFKNEEEALVNLGFISKGPYGIPGRKFFSLYNDEMTYGYVHLHAYPEGHKDIAEKLSLKESLIQDDSLRDAYSQFKAQLIEKGVSRQNYPAAKTPFIRKILEHLPIDL